MCTGKQVVYHALQDTSQDMTPEAIATLNQDTEKLQDQLSTIKANEKRARAALAALEAKPRISDLQQQTQRLEEEREGIQAHLGQRHGDDEAQISLDERTQLEQEWKQWQRHAAVRRRICRDLWGRCSEVLPEDMTSQELWVSRH